MSISVIEQRIVAGAQFNGGVTGPAAGTITTVAGSALVSGESFFLKDGKSAEVEFRFYDLTTDTPPTATRTLRPVPFDGGYNASEVRDRIIAAINYTRSLNLLASNGGASQVDLLNRTEGAFGNVTPTADTVADGGFVVSAMVAGFGRLFVDYDDRARIFEPTTDGGQFDFPFTIPQAIDGITAGGWLTWVVDRMLLDSTTATTYTVKGVTPDGTEYELATGSGGVDVLGPFTLGGDDRLQVVTTGATGAMLARVWARPELPLPPGTV